ncbi:hypothetical protein [Parafrankia discariae]|nr:hypothetical protein [Parafrankia discariae]
MCRRRGSHQPGRERALVRWNPLKRGYDPENRFRLNPNIPPAQS